MNDPLASASIMVPVEHATARISSQNPAKLWIAAILLMVLGVVATAWFPLNAVPSLPSENYNEGWNAYRQWMALTGQPLYGAQTPLWTTNYPFLSFHVIGLLAGARSHMVETGRIVCFLSLIATSLLIGAIIREVTASRAGAIYAGLCLFAWLACFYGDGRAANDPEMLSLALSGFGLFAFFKAGGRNIWITLSAIAFALSLFTKHDLIAFPLSIAAHLLITRNWRALAVFFTAGVISSALLLALTFHLDGRFFFNAVLQPRAYSLQNLIAETLHYLLHFLIPLLVGAVLLSTDRTTPHRNFLVTLLIFTNLIAICFAGGDGVASNIFYAPAIADLLACVTAICQLAHRNAWRNFQTALILTTLAGALMVPFQLRTDIIAQLRMPTATQAAQQAITQLASTPGPDICEDLLLCFYAGKPIGYDPYYVKDQIRVGHLQESGILASLAAQQYAAIQINGTMQKALLWQGQSGRFTQPFLHALLAQYRPVIANRYYSVFVPNLSPTTNARAAGG